MYVPVSVLISTLIHTSQMLYERATPRPLHQTTKVIKKAPVPKQAMIQLDEDPAILPGADTETATISTTSSATPSVDHSMADEAPAAPRASAPVTDIDLLGDEEITPSTMTPRVPERRPLPKPPTQNETPGTVSIATEKADEDVSMS